MTCVRALFELLTPAPGRGFLTLTGPVRLNSNAPAILPPVSGRGTDPTSPPRPIRDPRRCAVAARGFRAFPHRNRLPRRLRLSGAF